MKNWSEMSTEERDAMVAEKVMGYSERFDVSQARSLKSAKIWRIAFKNKPQVYLDIGSYKSFVTRDGTKISCGEPHSVHFPKSFSTSISSAFEVAEKLKSEWQFAVAWIENKGKWQAGFWKDHVTHFESESDTASEAICLAALKAVGVEV